MVLGRVSTFLRREFTFRRWGTNPAQMYMILLLTVFSLLQIIFGTNPNNVIEKAFDTQLTTLIAVCNAVGGTVALYGLHMREFDRSISVESWGYLSLVFVMTLYVYLVLFNPDYGFPNLTFALALSEAFVLSSLHRLYQIYAYFRAVKHHDKIQVWAMLGRLDKNGPMP